MSWSPASPATSTHIFLRSTIRQWTNPQILLEWSQVMLVSKNSFYTPVIFIWVNYNISLTWIKAIWGWFPLLTMIPVRSQWGRYNFTQIYGISECPQLDSWVASVASVQYLLGGLPSIPVPNTVGFVPIQSVEPSFFNWFSPPSLISKPSVLIG